MGSRRCFGSERRRLSSIYLYGPPGSGKTTVGRLLAQALDREFIDMDTLIESRAGRTVAEIFEQEGEAGFRESESRVLREVSRLPSRVVSLGGGALLRPENRALAETSGEVVRLVCRSGELLRRLGASTARPLVAGSNGRAQLERLLAERDEHYRSFENAVDATGRDPEDVRRRIQRMLGVTRVKGMGEGYDAILRRGAMLRMRETLASRGITPPYVVISDDNVAPIWSGRLFEGAVPLIRVPAGEASKSLVTIARLYDDLLDAGLERGGAVIALGGGVVGDIAGFVASTIFRGVRWVNVPTSLLAMVDASLGGKVGVDLPRGKNLVGAFHPPSIVVSDPETLVTLPREEFVSGLAEVVKAAIIGDPELFGLLEGADLEDPDTLDEVLFRSIQVKRAVIEADPYERDVRASLNLGHTIGHAIEHESGYALRHGEAVAIGLVAETRLAESVGLCPKGLANRLGPVLERLGLPTRMPDMPPRALRQRMSLDKKTQAGRLKFALPETIGRVRVGVEVPDSALMPVLGERLEIR